MSAACVHRLFLDRDRDSWSDGYLCSAPAVSYSIHPVTGEPMPWCIVHAEGRDDTQLIEQTVDQTIEEGFEEQILLERGYYKRR